MKLHELTQLDEMHPMTSMMNRALNPPKDVKFGADSPKKKKKQLTKDEANKTDTCRGCGDSGVVYNTGLCSDCAKDTYDDR